MIKNKTNFLLALGGPVGWLLGPSMGPVIDFGGAAVVYGLSVFLLEGIDRLFERLIAWRFPKNS